MVSVTAESATLQGRAAAEALMVDACRIERPDGAGAVNEVTGRVEPRWAAVYEGACRFQQPALLTVLAETPGLQSTLQRFVVSVPIEVAAARVGDRVTATACRLDPQVVGRQFRVIALHHKSQATARRFTAEEVTG